jgi:hypothetical protein
MSRKYLPESPKRRETRSIRDRKRYAANPVPVRERSRAWRAENPEEMRERNRIQYLKKRETRINRRKLVPREAVIENHLREQIEARNGLCIKFMDPGQNGAPDRLVVLHGHPTYYVELKRPHLGVLEDSQKRYHQRLRDRGQRVWVLWSKEDVDTFINEISLT